MFLATQSSKMNVKKTEVSVVVVLVLVSVGVARMDGLRIRATLVWHLCHYLVLPGHICVGGDGVTLCCYDHTALVLRSRSLS